MIIDGETFDCFSEDLDDPTDDPSVDRYDENDQPCMGEGCLNPHPDHSLAECYTLEMCEAQNEEGEAAS